MNTVEMLDELQNKALHDEELKNKFLKTKEEEDSPKLEGEDDLYEMFFASLEQTEILR